jgi:hypothetical protein
MLTPLTEIMFRPVTSDKGRNDRLEPSLVVSSRLVNYFSKLWRAVAVNLSGDKANPASSHRRHISVY